MISISNLSKKYGDFTALNDVSLNIKSGSIYGLLGPNGAGKTTLLSTLVGLNAYDSGDIVIENKNLRNDLSYIRSISAIVPQNLAFYPTLTAKENLEFFGGMLGLKNDLLKERMAFAIEKTKLGEVYNKQSMTYSGGLKRRLNIAIGLLSDPKIIYFDEPTVGIDPQSRNFILETIKEMKQDNRLVVYTSHYMEEVEFLCDKIAIMDHGKIIKEGNLETILSGFKATVKIQNTTMEIELDQLSKELDKLIKNGQKIESIEYGQNLQNYFLQMTDKELRD